MGIILSGALGLAGCTGDEKTGAGTATPAPAGSTPIPSATVPDSLFVAQAPESAQNVAQALTTAKEGETIVVRARIGGSREPFVDGRASFVVSDMSMKPCNENPGDTCESPWDFCCEDRAGKVASIQIVGADGAVLKSTAKGVHGLRPLSIVVVEGKVGPRPDKNSLVLNAQRIFVEPPPAAPNNKP